MQWHEFKPLKPLCRRWIANKNRNKLPYGHTALAFSTVTTLLLTTEKWHFAAPAYVWAIGVGYSLIYLGQNYPSDVIAGAVTGAAGAYLNHIMNKKWLHPVRKKTVQLR